MGGGGGECLFPSTGFEPVPLGYAPTVLPITLRGSGRLASVETNTLVTQPSAPPRNYHAWNTPTPICVWERYRVRESVCPLHKCVTFKPAVWMDPGGRAVQILVRSDVRHDRPIYAGSFCCPCTSLFRFNASFCRLSCFFVLRSPAMQHASPCVAMLSCDAAMLSSRFKAHVALRCRRCSFAIRSVRLAVSSYEQKPVDHRIALISVYMQLRKSKGPVDPHCG